MLRTSVPKFQTSARRKQPLPQLGPMRSSKSRPPQTSSMPNKSMRSSELVAEEVASELPLLRGDAVVVGDAVVGAVVKRLMTTPISFQSSTAHH